MKERIKEIAFKHGADLFGVAPVARFDGAPQGFHPRSVYSRKESVIAFAIKLPTETLFAESPIPFTHVNTLAIQRVDAITYAISTNLDRDGVKNVLIPTDDPYEYWDPNKQEGRAILSLRHAAMLAGLGKIGRNNLLINKKYSNMIQIGALLTDRKIEPDPLADYEACPPECRICLDSCPQRALTGETVIQKLCRPISNFRTEKGYIVKKCFECRRKCPRRLSVNRIFLLSLALILALAMVSCAPGPNGFKGTTDNAGVTAGFLLGLWHGLISPITFIVSLFSKNVNFYEVHNNGGWYNFGFVLGAGLFLSGGILGHKKK